ncbi:hypothetical protein, partial [Porphyrobacter sp. TH134]|uniref:hypothetical protein n=1 Tax=Porphyrobacter sp. TH134 TaxID=2067450 RepID=UPI003FA38C6E
SRKTIRREIDQAKATPRKAGCRLTAPVNCPSTTGLGTQVMEALAHGLDGRLEVVGTAPGTRAILHFAAAWPPQD